MTTQLDCSLGFKKETTYGTAVTVDRFAEFTEESLAREPTFVQGAGMRVGSRVARSKRRVLVKDQAGGDFTVEMVHKGLGPILEALFGVATSTLIPAQTGAYQQLFTPTKTDPLPSYTIQKGIPPIGGGAVTAMTFLGAVCMSGEFSASAADIVKLKTTWNAREVKTDIAYAAPSYVVDPELFHFAQGAITIGGSQTLPTATAPATGGTVAATIEAFTLTYDNKIDEGGFNLGGGGKRIRKPVVGLADVKGKVTAEYSDTILRDAYMNQTPLALTLTFTSPVIIGTSANPVLQIHIPDLRLEGELPKAAGGSPVKQEIDFTVLDNLLAPLPIYVSLVTTDAAI
ncbi:phage tail tube protein [Pseudarthrobacter sp. J64]|uniref:phage tail tube protein n=1 Tax=Pseudarthrobacter sp. J64 TaxID=3116485 RepID=UPI002E813C0E|nr:phage tail tube protein [Pseudarthrobacter sp. J64]MEE2568604.1 phage tail tube protein [Pseudarthrobacter sp. J64]